ncbi:DDE-type integrase/transposase/recombinase [Microbispora cellulosiformans]|uniref:DDE-type integrase/transposase/recombinase n=2 Tax=Microbispora cellulosiformans TaxID=2614688 RepID=A0A5J5JWU9_9ACTN|nr:DDE-type integrase/transposase/recombinase [Microbispora cellulosiformans]
MVDRLFARSGPDQLWVTDITEHPTREGKVYCCVVLDAYSQRVVGWSIDSTQTATLVTNALGMAIHNRNPQAGTVIHSDHGVQYSRLHGTRGTSRPPRNSARFDLQYLPQHVNFIGRVRRHQESILKSQ